MVIVKILLGRTRWILNYEQQRKRNRLSFTLGLRARTITTRGFVFIGTAVGPELNSGPYHWHGYGDYRRASAGRCGRKNARKKRKNKTDPTNTTTSRDDRVMNSPKPGKRERITLKKNNNITIVCVYVFAPNSIITVLDTNIVLLLFSSALLPALNGGRLSRDKLSLRPGSDRYFPVPPRLHRSARPRNRTRAPAVRESRANLRTRNSHIKR